MAAILKQHAKETAAREAAKEKKTAAIKAAEEKNKAGWVAFTEKWDVILKRLCEPEAAEKNEKALQCLNVKLTVDEHVPAKKIELPSSQSNGEDFPLDESTFKEEIHLSINDKEPELSNNEQHQTDHDEIDIEFLGTTPDKPYVLQTNVWTKGSGDGNRLIGREHRFHLWFDPTHDYHNYAILYNPTEIIFMVDDVPIRRYPRKSDATFPLRPMWVYGSIWDASSWATENGKYKADYNYQPFIGRYKDFKLGLGSAASPSGTTGMSRQQYTAMDWVQRNYKVYDYCTDSKRDHSQTPEC
ncbi:hypothetical protein ACLB2K_022141 [Fragaria x ananassa]